MVAIFRLSAIRFGSNHHSQQVFFTKARVQATSRNCGMCSTIWTRSPGLGLRPAASLPKRSPAIGLTLRSRAIRTGKAFLLAFTKALGGTQPDPYAVYAAQAAIVLLNAISKSNGTRGSVTQQIFKTNLPNSITGTVRFNANGDVQGGPVAIYLIKAGKSTDYTVLFPPSSLVKKA